MAWLCPRAASGPWASAFSSSRRGLNTCLEEAKWGAGLAQESAESCWGCTSRSPLSRATSERDRKVALKGGDDRGRGGAGTAWRVGASELESQGPEFKAGGAGSQWWGCGGLLLPSQPRKEASGLDWLVQRPWCSPARLPASRLVTFIQGILDTLPWIWAWTPKEAGTLPTHLGRPSEWGPVVSTPGPGVGSLELPAGTQPSGLPAGPPCLQGPSEP